MRSQLFLFVAFLLTLTVYASIMHTDNRVGQSQEKSNPANRKDIAVSSTDNNDGFARSRYKRNNVATDPNNIRFVLGNTQLFPIPNFEETVMTGTVPSSQSQHLLSTNSNDKVSELAVDVANIGGTHQNNINIGGIQNFGGEADAKAEIAKLIIADKNNIGGSHQNNVAIGGILNFS